MRSVGASPACARRRDRHVLPIARDSWTFLKLLAQTLASLPSDVLAASIVINLLGLALPLGILQVYDRVIPHAATATLAMLIIGIGCALVMEMILRIVRSHVIAWSAMKLAWKTNVEAASRIATAPADLVDAQPAARWIQRLQAVATISDFHISPAPLLLIDLVFVVIFFALLVASSGWLAAVPLVVFLLFGVAAIERGRELRKATAERMVAEAKIRDFLVEALNGIVTVKALGTEQQILRRFERLSEQAAGCTYSIVRLADDAQSFGSMVSILTQIATATIGAILAINGQISIGVVACSTMLAGRVIQPLLRLVAAWNEIQGVMVARRWQSRSSICRRANTWRTPARRSRASAGAGSCSTTSRSPMTRAGAPSSPEPAWMSCPAKSSPSPARTTSASPRYGASPPASCCRNRARSGSTASRPRCEARQRGTVRVVDHQNATVRGSVLNNLTLFRDAEQLEAARAGGPRRSASKPTSIGCRAATTRASGRPQARPCPPASCSASPLPGPSPASPACSSWTKPTAPSTTRASWRSAPASLRSRAR